MHVYNDVCMVSVLARCAVLQTTIHKHAHAQWSLVYAARIRCDKATNTYNSNNYESMRAYTQTSMVETG